MLAINQKIQAEKTSLHYCPYYSDSDTYTELSPIKESQKETNIPPYKVDSLLDYTSDDSRHGTGSVASCPSDASTEINKSYQELAESLTLEKYTMYPNYYNDLSRKSNQPYVANSGTEVQPPPRFSPIKKTEASARISLSRTHKKPLYLIGPTNNDSPTRVKLAATPAYTRKLPNSSPKTSPSPPPQEQAPLSPTSIELDFERINTSNQQELAKRNFAIPKLKLKLNTSDISEKTLFTVDKELRTSTRSQKAPQSIEPKPCMPASTNSSLVVERVATKKAPVIRKVKLPHSPAKAFSKKPIVTDTKSITTTAGKASLKPKQEPVSSEPSLSMNPEPLKSKRRAASTRRARPEPYAAARRGSSTTVQELSVSPPEKNQPSTIKQESAATSRKRRLSSITVAPAPRSASKRKTFSGHTTEPAAVTTNKRTPRRRSSVSFIVDLNVLTIPKEEEEFVLSETLLPVVHMQERSDEDISSDEEDSDYMEEEQEADVVEQDATEESIDYLLLIQEDPVLKSLRIDNENLTVFKKVLGEGQAGIVHAGSYNQLPVACKTKRVGVVEEDFYFQIFKELSFAHKLSNCRNTVRYLGWTIHDDKFYLVQRLIENGDARKYLFKRGNFFPAEVLTAGICLFSALTDAHAADIGIVDLKLENYLIDSSGSGFLTDFGSCVEFYGREDVDLEDEEVPWTKSVAAPEMVSKHRFSKASDVFMGTLILAELMTAQLSDTEFKKKVLCRKAGGAVDFSPKEISSSYSCYFDLLSKGLKSGASCRPSAEEMLYGLIALKRSDSAMNA
ncbi:hypothetical protein HPULCUR_002353 [Helicostylum pulchrum]|uniref:mitogen-activated protein kinase kinase n=1 Tax=Helicostylum pulchrum TaxID=562976 RepID=A0ABP9XRI1_9FUNG